MSWAILPTLSFAHRQCVTLGAHWASLTERFFSDVGSHFVTYHVLTPPLMTQSRNPLTFGSVNHVVLFAYNVLRVVSVNLTCGIVISL